MRRFLGLIAATGIIMALATGVQAQNRNFGARTFTMDDGAGHSYTMMTPSGMTGNVTYTFPTPPAGNPPAGFVNVGTTPGQTLFWNGTSLAWEASSIITNNLNGNGVGVSITAPLTLSNLAVAGIVHNAAGGLLSTSAVNLASADVTGILPVANGGTGSASQNFVDLTTNQSVAGNKTLTGTTVANTLSSSGATITGGSIAGTPISGNTGSFTALAASTSETFSNFATAGIVHNAAGGLLSTSALSAADVAAAGTLSNNTTGHASQDLALAGGTMTGPINMGAQNITNAGSIAGTSLSVTGNITTTAGSIIFPATTASNVGTITQTGIGPILHTFGSFTNLFIGFSAGNFTLTNNQNVQVGGAGMGNLSSGNQNTGLGWSSNANLTTGSSNVALGAGALFSNHAGSNNVAIGLQAGINIDGGSNNTFIGGGASVPSGSGLISNSVALGAGAVVTASNTIQLGNGSVSLVNTTASINTSTGFQVGGAATTGNYLRGNGTNFVSSTIQAADIAAAGTLSNNTTGTASNVTGIVALANGGTGVTNASSVAQNAFFGGPSGSAGAASFRTLTTSDIPANLTSYIQNQSAGPQAASNFNISGTGTSTDFVSPLFQGADASPGTLTTLRAGNGATAAANGGSLLLYGGNGGGVGPDFGGNIGINGGLGVGAGGVGGTVNLNGGTGAGGATSGSVLIATNSTTAIQITGAAGSPISMPAAGGLSVSGPATLSGGMDATASTIQTTGSVKAGTLNGAAAAPLTQGALNASVAITKFAANVSLFVGSTSVTLTGSATRIDPNAVVMIVVKNTTPTNFTAYVANTASGTTTVNLSGAADGNTTISYIIVNP